MVIRNAGDDRDLWMECCSLKHDDESRYVPRRMTHHVHAVASYVKGGCIVISSGIEIYVFQNVLAGMEA